VLSQLLHLYRYGSAGELFGVGLVIFHVHCGLEGNRTTGRWVPTVRICEAFGFSLDFEQELTPISFTPSSKLEQCLSEGLVTLDQPFVSAVESIEEPARWESLELAT
jgi:hypothetical protein